MRHIFLWILLFASTLPTYAWAASLEAVVDRAEINQNESLVLTLTLTDAEAQASPSLAPLQSYFTIEKQAATQTEKWDRGQMRPAMRWHYQLRPLRSGRLVIPALDVSTEQGAVSARPITVTITPAALKNPRIVAKEQDADITVIATPATTTPYVGQLVMVRATVYRGPNIMEALLDKPVAGSSRIEPVGVPDVSYQLRDEVRWMQTDLLFSLTPLQYGALTLQPLRVKGSKFIHRLRGNDMQTFYDAASDPITNPAAMFNDKREVVPFEHASEPVVFEVRPIPPQWQAPAQRWLPLPYLTLTQEVDSTKGKVGEPIVRRLHLELLGAMPQALPELLPLLQEGQEAAQWQIFAGKPETRSEYDAEYRTLRSHVTQSFTYVPKQAGSQSLPAIRLPWWDLTAEKQQHAVVPAYAVEIAPSDAQPTASAPVSPQASEASMLPTLLIGVFLFVACSAVAGWWVMQKSLHPSFALRPRTPKPPKEPDALAQARIKLEAASDVMGLAGAVELFLRLRFGFAASLSLSERAAHLGTRLPAAEATQLQTLSRLLEQSAYGGGRALTIESWRRQWLVLIEKAAKNRSPEASASPKTQAMSLNP